MKITAIEAIPYAIPYSKALKFASGEVHVVLWMLLQDSQRCYCRYCHGEGCGGWCRWCR